MKKSWFDWKISCLFNTYQPFLIHSFPKNYNNSQQCFMETYEDLKRHSEKRHKRFHIYTTTQHEVILVLREKPKSYFNGVSVFFFTFFWESYIILLLFLLANNRKRHYKYFTVLFAITSENYLKLFCVGKYFLFGKFHVYEFSL